MSFTTPIEMTSAERLAVIAKIKRAISCKTITWVPLFLVHDCWQELRFPLERCVWGGVGVAVWHQLEEDTI